MRALALTIKVMTESFNMKNYQALQMNIIILKKTFTFPILNM